MTRSPRMSNTECFALLGLGHEEGADDPGYKDEDAEKCCAGSNARYISNDSIRIALVIPGYEPRRK
jgi:hypothetical protein